MNKEKIKIASAIILIIGYLGLMAYYIPQEKYIIFLLPLLLLGAAFIILKMDQALLMIYFLVPLSIPLREYFPGLGIDMYLPTEPILVILSFLFIVKIFIEGKIPKAYLYHPITLSIYFSLFWIFITSLTSSLPAVSFKFLGSRLWFVIPFYFLAVLLFAKKENIRWFIYLYSSALVIVVIYTINKHLGYGLNDQEASNWVCSPFYNDHTAYGAALAFTIILLIPFTFLKSVGKKLRIFTFGLLGILFFALVFSYTRAAWLSMVGAFGILGLVLFRVKFKYVALVAIISIGSIAFFYTDIIHALEKNEQDSSGTFSEHITSMANISTDASNVERLNRWNTAIRMFKEKPIFGWGPGTYMFQYAPFQYARERTIISTNFGDGGNAHSEYLSPMAESGIFGIIYFLLISIVSLISGFRIYHKALDPEIRWIALFTTLALITYLLHGILNNFLDTDKLSALFWGGMAVLVSLDVYHVKKKKQ